MTHPRKTISIVTPCFNEEDNVVPCYEAVRKLFEGELAGYEREHIFCDNNSSDRTVTVLKGIAETDKCLKIIVNARNFGPFRSLFNGLLSTRGDAVVVFLPADLQDPPELIPQFVKNWEHGYEVVFGIRAQREESYLMQFIRRVYYRLVSRLANIKIPMNAGEYQLIDRKVVQALHQFEDYYPYVRGMIASCGFRSTGIEYLWKARARGHSKNSWYNLIDQGLNGLISFTNLPMRLCMFAGFSTAGLSFLAAFFHLVLSLIFFGQAPPGIPTLIVGLFFLLGLQLFFFGVLGEYISAIHSQVRRRPLVVERERINFDLCMPIDNYISPPNEQSLVNPCKSGGEINDPTLGPKTAN